MRSEGYGSCPVCPLCVCMCVCVCLSVKSHLTSGASVYHENATTYLVGTESQKGCGVFSEFTPLPRSSAPSFGWPFRWSAIFPADKTHAHCSYESSPRFAMDAPCCKLTLRSSFTMIILGLESSSCISCYLSVCMLYLQDCSPAI